MRCSSTATRDAFVARRARRSSRNAAVLRAHEARESAGTSPARPASSARATAAGHQAGGGRRACGRRCAASSIFATQRGVRVGTSVRRAERGVRSEDRLLGRVAGAGRHADHSAGRRTGARQGGRGAASPRRARPRRRVDRGRFRGWSAAGLPVATFDRLSAADLRAMLATQNRFTLLDVRSTREWSTITFRDRSTSRLASCLTVSRS